MFLWWPQMASFELPFARQACGLAAFANQRIWSWFQNGWATGGYIYHYLLVFTLFNIHLQCNSINGSLWVATPTDTNTGVEINVDSGQMWTVDEHLLAILSMSWAPQSRKAWRCKRRARSSPLHRRPWWRTIQRYSEPCGAARVFEFLELIDHSSTVQPASAC